MPVRVERIILAVLIAALVLTMGYIIHDMMTYDDCSTVLGCD